jgi:ferritin-like protein
MAWLGSQTMNSESMRRRSFLKGLGLAGAAGAAMPAGALADAPVGIGRLTRGDADILRFLAAAEIIETDLWTQYNELGGVNGGNPSYTAALQNLDGDMSQYITDNTDDEVSHADFLNAYLVARDAEPVDLDEFRTLPSSLAAGALQTGRLTNLLSLDVDTSWYTRYRSDGSPDFGDTFAQAVTIAGEPAIPLNDIETPPATDQPKPPTTDAARRMQAIANTAAFHFAMIEQGGASLYATLSLRVTSPEVLRILVSIGGVEVNHFAIWHDKVGNAVSMPLAGLIDPIAPHVTFPDLNNPGGELVQTNKIMPEPCRFISDHLPRCSVIRPSRVGSGAVAAVTGLTNSKLFDGQSDKFFATIKDLARAADRAFRRP